MPHGRDDSAAGQVGRAMLVTTGLLVLALTLLLAVVAWTREGNLAWDDADYLRRALHNVGRAEARGGFNTLPALVRLTLKERPKPPCLVAWIEAARWLLGPRDDLRPLIVAATAVPFGLLLTAVAVLARRLGGPRAALLATLALTASPMALAFGAKVMVETFMALWTLLALAAAARLRQRPTPGRAVALGLALGLALLTKLTALLLLPLPLLAVALGLTRRHARDRAALARLGLAVLIPAAVVAGPWYARNGRAAFEFAAWSSRYQQVAEDRSDVVPTRARLEALAGQLAGWPATALLIVALACFATQHREGQGGSTDEPPGSTGDESADFVRLTGLGGLGGTLVLLQTSYFDPRFLLPIWAAVAVALGVVLGGRRESMAGWPRALGARVGVVAGVGLLLLGLTHSIDALRREPRNTTFWNTRRLLDDLVERHHVATIGNLGNCADWNVCKTGLMNELRPDARNCFVLLDVSQWSPAEIDRRLDRLDAVVVLDGPPLTETVRSAAPGLNRGYDPARNRLRDGLQFDRVGLAIPDGLPPLSVYVRRR